MNFGFTEEQELLRTTAREFLAKRAPMGRVREVMDGPEPEAPELWHALGELGWTGLAIPEDLGGAGLGMVELGLVVEELGRSLAPVPFLPTAIAGLAVLELGDEKQQREWLSRIAAGQAAATLAITEAIGGEEAGDLELAAERETEGWVLRGCKHFVPDAARADWIATVARSGEALEVFAVPRDADGLCVEPMRSVDLLRPLYSVHFDGVRLDDGARLAGAGALETVLDRARVVISAEMLGAAQKCLDDSVAYAKDRVQFGRPIGANQAIKHKCADMLFQVESARSLTYWAAWAADRRDEEAALAASMAKSYVGDACSWIAGENIQIHGGVGFTWETDCHLYFKRAKSDECWLGDSRYHRERVARLMEF